MTGTWNHGIRNGPFTFDTNKQESEVKKSSACENLSFLGSGDRTFSQVTYLEGEYKDDCLEGLTRVQWKDGSWFEGFYKGGVIHGFARRFDSDKQLSFIGMYR